MKKCNSSYRIAAIFLLAICMLSCNERSRNLTGRVRLLEYTQTNDTVDFYINEIMLIDVERDVNVRIDDRSPGISLFVSVTNKTDKAQIFKNDYVDGCFIGLNPSVRKDTMYFSSSLSSHYEVIQPEQTIDLQVFCTFPLFIFKDDTKFDNTEPLLNVIKDMKFYYVPLPMDDMHIGRDTTALKNSYRIRVDSNTQIKSHSWIHHPPS